MKFLDVLSRFRRSKSSVVRGHLHQALTLRYKVDVIRGGRTVHSTPFVDHMITDTGLDAVATMNNIVDGITAVSLGTAAAPTPVRRDGGGTTFSQAVSTLTASAAFFSAADVGRLFKFGVGTGGAESYITGYTSPTQVTVSTVAAIGAAAGVVWYVNRDRLDTPLAGVTWAPEAGSSGTASAVVGSVCTLTHTFITVSSAMAAGATIYEIGFGATNGLGLFDRDIIPAGVGLLLGDQARVTAQLIINYSPVTPAAQGNLATGYDSSGSLQWEGFGFALNPAFAFLNASGTVAAGSMEPSKVIDIYTETTNFAFGAFNVNNNSAARARVLSSTAGYKLAYGTGNRYIDKGQVFQTSDSNTTIYGFCLGKNGNGQFGAYKLTTSFTKNNTQRLTVVFRFSWDRVLQN